MNALTTASTRILSAGVPNCPVKLSIGFSLLAEARASKNGRRKFKRQLEERHKYEAIFWFQGEKRDEVGPRVEAVIKQIEEITKSTLAGKDIWSESIWKG